MHLKVCNALLIAGLMLPASPASAQAPAREIATTPTGEGNPDGITCRPPQQLPGSRLLGPEVCKSNALWAQYRKDGMDVAADGIHDVPSEKTRSTNPMSCRPAFSGGGGTSTNQMNMGTVCN
jgi:hypothetical protein